jgi:hypothetical protein
VSSKGSSASGVGSLVKVTILDPESTILSTVEPNVAFKELPGRWTPSKGSTTTTTSFLGLGFSGSWTFAVTNVWLLEACEAISATEIALRLLLVCLTLDCKMSECLRRSSTVQYGGTPRTDLFFVGLIRSTNEAGALEVLALGGDLVISYKVCFKLLDVKFFQEKRHELKS